MDFFHRPTLDLSTMQPVLLLAVCNLGLFLTEVPEAYETGKILHAYLWKTIFAVGFSRKRVDRLTDLGR